MPIKNKIPDCGTIGQFDNFQLVELIGFLAFAHLRYLHSSVPIWEGIDFLTFHLSIPIFSGSQESGASENQEMS